jgi:glutathione S-transferase
MWLDVLDMHLLGAGKKYMCGDDITIADYLGAGMISLTELIHCNLASYTNLARWYATMKARPNWAKSNEVFYGFVGAMKEKEFEAV